MQDEWKGLKNEGRVFQWYELGADVRMAVVIRVDIRNVPSEAATTLFFSLAFRWKPVHDNGRYGMIMSLHTKQTELCVPPRRYQRAVDVAEDVRHGVVGMVPFPLRSMLDINVGMHR